MKQNQPITPKKKVTVKSNASAGLTKKVKAEILGVHDRYWSCYLKGDVKTMTTLLAEGYSQVGSAETEVFFNKKDAVKFLRDTIKEVAGKVDMRRRVTKLEVQGDLILVHELCDLYGKADKKWVFYSKFRASTWLKQINKSWKIIHQHSSFPDARTDEGENLAIEKIEEENQLLREAVKRHTVELEQKKRELEIESAMEKVRVRSLAMQKPEELEEVAEVLRNEMGALGVEELETSSIYIMNANGTAKCWYAIKDVRGKNKKLVTDHMTMSLDDTWVGIQMQKFQRSKKTRASILMRGENRKEWINYCAGKSSVLQGYYDGEIPERTYHLLKFSNGFMGAASPGTISEESWDLLQRATAVFSFAYKRFSDLQKAEAQAREAQIEAALERVRSRSMGMQKSNELKDVIQLVFEQLLQLNFKADSASFALDYKNTDDFYLWSATRQQTYPILFHIPYIDNPIFNQAKEAKERGHDFISALYSFEEKNAFWQHLFNHASIVPKDRQEYLLSTPGYSASTVMMDSVSLTIINYDGDAFSDAENAILKRFARVFEQAYVRFLDLQRAEVQAREAIIEAALEKVRGKAMAMHSSNDLTATAGIVFTELRKLGINSLRGGVGLMDNKESRLCKMYSATSSEEGDTLSLGGTIKLDGHPVLSKIWDCIVDQSEYFPVLKGELLESYYSRLSSAFKVPFTKSTHKEEYGCFLAFSEGGFYVWSDKPYTEIEIKILQRFRSIVDLTFRRYLELQKSEAAASDAIRKASLDRVRADIASMRSTADLDRITPLIWKELTTLGIPFIRCGVFIMDDKENKVHTYLSTPDGRAIAAFHTPMDDSGSLAGSIEHWRLQRQYVTHWVDSDFQLQADILLKQGAITSREQYLSTLPKEGFYLHFLPFRQGMLYVGSNESLHADALQLVHALADAFSVAYARYEDFTKLELAKQQIEKTLTDLKQTQTQLIQSEKMASLGELTAGIAHEIQNPLNFVNNFSELNTELIDELRSELAVGNRQSAEEIANDIKSNSEKINHHGKRAGDIVKGMLQHSRSSSGVKEPTDINALADEYLRLAYHGFRAKDKSFNATMQTEFDETIGSINIIPQDIGRVILNLITNAFYAVSTEALAQVDSEYTPTVSVSTKKSGDKILISVKDNGNGIPDSIKEKIFQPFFTTKPTGQGTGLGLSLSYDIVKAHGGELRVETREGEGSEFIISLPIV
jgi:signal transduction histidine kinase/ketosteroid isomerase-like protein